MDVTKYEIEYLIGGIQNDKVMWEHDLEMHRKHESLGLQLLSAEGLARTELALKTLNLLERKLKAYLKDMEVK